MKVKELIQQLSKYADDDRTCVYLNYEKNWEDEFVVVKTDAGTVDLVPTSKFIELSTQQEFEFEVG